ncbi:Ribonuclease 1 [Phytophthora citrophthora]|uniref:Ribonuclease 1 n=1 Tax=Phytophthora citrophthora TaxID=4793 RepID=A0AAD9LDF9_9STRA|nr:Ribonuclease 1 [Phytophthora citrophthora]
MFASFASVLLASTLLAVDLQTSTATATNYAGGWSTTNPTSECVDICSAPSKTCLTSDATCLAKTMVPGDFDYMVLEQLFVPQFCRDLLKGYDSTISHQNIDVYPNGTTCVASRVKSELTIHGLWPNYDDGYVSCCNPSTTVTNDPYDAAAFALLESDLLSTMGEKWVDATQESTYDTLCEIYDHEFQKHGLCYHADGDDYISAAVAYFTATLNTAERLSSATEQINKWAEQENPQTTLAEIEALYDHDVIVLCSSVDGNNTLSSIRTCYEKPSNITSDGPTTQSDCAAITASTPFKYCSGEYPIQLTAYVAPDASSSAPATIAPATTTPATTTPATTTPATTTPVTTTPVTTIAPATTTPATTTPVSTTAAPIQPHVPRTQPFCQLFNQRGFCGLLWFCEWSVNANQCNGRNYF